jgi:multimeric flavodoxin WrbA
MNPGRFKPFNAGENRERSYCLSFRLRKHKKMAEAIVSGFKASQAAASISLKIASDVSAHDLLHADVIIFGTPVHMGSMAWQLKKLIDETAKLWMEGALEGKIGGVFATGGGLAEQVVVLSRRWFRCIRISLNMA